MSRHISDAGLALVKSMEGLRLESYQDPAGIWTVGYGHTPAKPGWTINQALADKLLRSDMAHAEQTVDSLTQDVATTDDQFSAMASLCFNIGAGGFRGSSVLRAHRAGQFQAAADAFLSWDKAHVNGQLVVLSGLFKRRTAERALYLGEATPSSAARTPSSRKTDPDHSANDLNRAELEHLGRGK